MDFILLFILIFFLNKIFVANIVNKNPNLSIKLLNNLFLYHLFFFVVYYSTTLFSRSDSNEYYSNACEIGSNFSLLSFTGTQFIDNFAAPFASLGLSYESMMLLFSWFGYIGFVYAYLFFKENIPVNVKVFPDAISRDEPAFKVNTLLYVTSSDKVAPVPEIVTLNKFLSGIT